MLMFSMLSYAIYLFSYVHDALQSLKSFIYHSNNIGYTYVFKWRGFSIYGNSIRKEKEIKIALILP